MPTFVVSTSGGGQPGCESGSHLVDAVAACVGGVDEDNVRVQALDAINRARNEVNMHDWRFLKRTVASSSFVDAQATYTLPSAFKSPSYFRILDINGKQFMDIAYLDDGSFAHWVPQQTESSQPPSIYTLRNTFNDGLITFFPIPNASTATNYTYAGEYYTRIANITDTPDALPSIPEEICNVLVAGGQYYLLAEREKGNPNIVNQRFVDYQRVKNLALVNDRRMTDDNARFRMPARRRTTSPFDFYGVFP